MKKSALRLVQDIVILFIFACLLYYGACYYKSGASSDVLIYQCYAVAFWQGSSGFGNLPPGQCLFIISSDKYVIAPALQGLLSLMQLHGLPSRLIEFIAAQSPVLPYHTLPYEYPLPALLPFSLGLVASANWYQSAFAIWILLLAACTYFILHRWQSRGTALAYTLYLLVGGWAIAATRFDLMPASLTLFAVICARHKRWNWAFVLLALATILKLYPVILLVPFLLAWHRGMSGMWCGWRKWLPIGLFVGICLLFINISLLLSVVGTLMPLEYFLYRPVEVESVSASILWICSLLGKTSLIYTNTFGSLNVLSSLSSNVTSRMIILLVVGLLYTWWLQWRKCIDLGMACLLTLLMVIVTGKVFSPQYLIWVIPLAAYVGQNNPCWILFWTAVGLLTSWIYPSLFHFFHIQPSMYALLFYSVTTARNFLLLGFVLFVLISVSRRRVEQSALVLTTFGQESSQRIDSREISDHPLSYDKERAKCGKQGGKNP